jgi:hypothetical protein
MRTEVVLLIPELGGWSRKAWALGQTKSHSGLQATLSHCVRLCLLSYVIDWLIDWVIYICLHAHMCTLFCFPQGQVRRGCWAARKWSWGWVWAPMWGLGIELRSFAKRILSYKLNKTEFQVTLWLMLCLTTAAGLGCSSTWEPAPACSGPCTQSQHGNTKAGLSTAVTAVTPTTGGSSPNCTVLEKASNCLQFS